MLFRALSELAASEQVILSPHTPMLARSLPDINLRYIKINDDNSREILVGNNETSNTFTKSPGVLPDNTVKIFIRVEGKNDISFLINISKVLIQNGVHVLDLEKMELDGDLIFSPLGGSNLALWASRLEILNRPEFHIYDRDNGPPDPPKYQDQVDSLNERINCIAVSTSKKEMENYLHKNAIIVTYDDGRPRLVQPVIQVILDRSIDAISQVSRIHAYKAHPRAFYFSFVKRAPWDVEQSLVRLDWTRHIF